MRALCVCGFWVIVIACGEPDGSGAPDGNHAGEGGAQSAGGAGPPDSIGGEAGTPSSAGGGEAGTPSGAGGGEPNEGGAPGSSAGGSPGLGGVSEQAGVGNEAGGAPASGGVGAAGTGGSGTMGPAITYVVAEPGTAPIFGSLPVYVPAASALRNCDFANPATDIGGGWCAGFYECDNGTITTACPSLGSETPCICKNLGDDWAFQAAVKLDAGASESACAALAPSCAAPERVGPSECIPQTVGLPDATSCHEENTCLYPLAADAGTDVSLQVLSEVRCTAGSYGLDCACTRNGTGPEPIPDLSGWSLYVSDPDAFTACKLLLPACEQLQELNFEEPACQTTMAETLDRYCTIQENCDVQAELGNGIEAHTEFARVLRCEEQPDGSHRCQYESPYLAFTTTDYDSPHTSFTFSIEADAGEPQCSSMIGTLGAGDFEFDGDWECTEGELSPPADSETECWNAFACRQSGRVGGQPAEGHGNLFVNCRPDDGEFLCKCFGARVESFALEAESLEGACAAASDRCPEVIEVVPFEPSRDYYPE